MMAKRLTKKRTPAKKGRTAKRAAGKKALVEALKAGEKEPVEKALPVFAKKRKFDPTDPAWRGPTIEKMSRTPLSLSEMAEFLGQGQESALLMVSSLQGAGYNVTEADGRYGISGKLLANTVARVLNHDRLRGAELRIGLLADPHLCSTKQRLDVVEAGFEEFKRQRIKTVYVLGNMIDGHLERINGSEVMLRNVTDQCAYMADHWPSRSGIKSKFITGDCHEGWYAKKVGLNVGRHMEDVARRRGRRDLEYIGHMEVDVELPSGGETPTVLRLLHPGGGSAYAQSYKAQKIVESYQGGEKPHVLAIGHYHKMGFFHPRGVPTVLAGCCQDQTRFMRKLQLSAHVGFVVLRLKFDQGGGVSMVTPEMYPFYDRQYHIERGDMWADDLAGFVG